jgi:hypothetical protein
MRCKWERQIVEATRSGLWTSSLRDHLRDCQQCTQTELIAASLQGTATETMQALELPSAGMVWRRAQAVQRERKLQRAVRRPFLIAGALGVVYSLVFVLWGVSQISASMYRWFALAPGQSGGVAFAGAFLSTIVAIVGSCMFLTENKR